MNTEGNNKIKVSLAGINTYTEGNTVTPTEKDVINASYVQWGEKNIYPQFIYNLYQNCPTLKSIITGIMDYTQGECVEMSVMTPTEAVQKVRAIAESYAVYGGFALNILRNQLGRIARVDVLDFKNVRSDKKNTTFYYSEDFSNNKSFGRCKTIVLPAFDKTDDTQMSSIYYYKNSAWTTYPLPVWCAAVEAAQAEKQIANYNLNSINNGFAANVIVSFNNGIPSDEVKEEIEEMFTQKYTGSENAGRPIISYADDKDHAVEISKIDQEDFGERFEAVQKYARQQLFTAFRANPNLFGINTEDNGFSQEQFDQTFKLFNKTTIKPLQTLIIDTFAHIFECEMKITPFKIDWDNND